MSSLRGFLRGFVAAVMLAVAALSLSAFVVLYLVPGYFESEYEKYDVLSSLPEMTMSENDGLMAVTDHMMDYLLRGDDPYELQIEVVMDGRVQPFFTEREILHMKDVRYLFRIAIDMSIGAGILAALILFGPGIVSRLEHGFGAGVSPRAHLGAGLVTGAAASVLVAGAAVLLGGSNFSELFVNFHLALFDNDLWLLDPARDMLINIVPEGFFFDTALRIGILWAFCMLLVIFAGARIIYKGSEKRLPVRTKV